MTPVSWASFALRLLFRVNGMKSEELDAKDLVYIEIKPDDYDPQKTYPVVFLLHGFGSTMYDIASIAPHINDKGYIYICPNGPLRVGVVNYAWTPRGPGSTPQDAVNAEDVLNSFYEEIFARHKTPQGKSALMGFSQGGRMTFVTGLTRPQSFAGLVGICAVFPQQADFEARFQKAPKQKVFIAYGEYDQTATVDRTLAAQKLLENAGYPMLIKGYPMGHQITMDVLNDVRTWLADILPPTA